jgi:uncharacterized protein
MSLFKWSFPDRQQTAPRAEAGQWRCATNATRGSVLAERLEVAETAAKRNKGLLGRSGLDAGTGLWISPCESVHTFFMQFPIDLVYLDRHQRIRKLRSNVGPWRISACFSAHSVIELPAGRILESESRVGDVLKLEPIAPPAALENGPIENHIANGVPLR